MKTATCKSCGAPIIWAKSATTGKAMPMDAEPVPDGKFALVEDSAGQVTAVFRTGLLDGEGHACHFATCPNANAHRKGAEQ